MTPQPSGDRDDRVRAALYRTRLLINRTPHFTARTRREANRAVDLLESQLGLNRVNTAESSRGLELLNRAAPSLMFGLLRDATFADRFAAALRRLGLRGIDQRLDEVSSSVMALRRSGRSSRSTSIPPSRRSRHWRTSRGSAGPRITSRWPGCTTGRRWS